MSDFFDKNLLQNLVSGILMLLLSIWLGSRGVNQDSGGRGWKIVVIISWIMIFGGLYMFGVNFQNGGFYNEYAGMGLSFFILGIILRWVGKFFVWWQR